jgi:hypothetical protein
MSLGNPDTGNCPNCKGCLGPIDWCLDSDCECTDDCNSFNKGIRCVWVREKGQCDKCGLIVEVD